MPIELKEPELVKQIEELASATTQSADRVLATAVQSYLDTLERNAIEAETQAYWAMHDKLTEDYAGEFVAMREGEVVDHDDDLATLEQRVRLKFGALPVLIAPVTPPPPRELFWRGGQQDDVRSS